MLGTLSGSSPSPGPSKELVFDITDAAFSSDEFRMYQFKVKRCPRAKPHDWTLCPFAHPGEKAKRRDPRKQNYSGTACPDFRKGGICPRGDTCPFAHGVFECWLHPSRYRTQMCTDGVNCQRRVCFFAHFESELRKAEADPILLSFQLHKDLGQDVRGYHHHQQMAHPLGAFMGAPPQSPQTQLMNGMQLGRMPAPIMLPGSMLHDSSAPCTPPTPTLTPATSQDSATLLAHLQMLKQQQAVVTAAAHDAQRPGSAPLSNNNSPAGHDLGAGPSVPLRSVSASTSGGTLGSSSSPPISPTGVAGHAAEAGVPTPSMPELAQSLKGPMSPLGALLQQQQNGSAAAAAAQLAMLAGGSSSNGRDAAALAMLLQQQMGLGASSYDQTALLVALHSLSLGGSIQDMAQHSAMGNGLIRHASDVYMQQRAAAAAAAAAMSPPGHGLVSHRRSMDNSMLAQLQSLSRSSPLPPDSYLQQGSSTAHITMEDCCLSPISVSSQSGVQLNNSLPPPSPSYLASLAAAVGGAPTSPLAMAAAERQQMQHRMSPPIVGGLQPVVTTAVQNDVGAGSSGMHMPATPQTAPAAMVQDTWSNQLCSIDEGEPVALSATQVQKSPVATVYKTLSDPSVLIRNLSFDNILAELPRSSSQVNLAAQQAAGSSDGISSSSKPE